MNKPCNNDELFAAYIDRRLSDEELKEFEEHLSRCPYCLEQLIIVWNEIREFKLDLGELETYEPVAAQTDSSMADEPQAVRHLLLDSLRVAAGSFPSYGKKIFLRAFASGIAALFAAVIISIFFFNILTSYAWDPGVIEAKMEIANLILSQNIGELRIAGYESSPEITTPVIRGIENSTSESRIERIRRFLAHRVISESDDYRNFGLLGDLLLASNQQQQAIVRYREALLIKPNDPKLLNNLAVAYYRAGRESSALKCLLQAEKIKEAPKEVFFNLAILYSNAGKEAEMERAARKYFSIDSSSKWAKKLAGMLRG